MSPVVTDEKFNTSVKFWIGSWIVGLLFPIMTSKMPQEFDIFLNLRQA